MYTSKPVHYSVSHSAGIQKIGSCTKSQACYGAPLVLGGERRPVSGTDRVGLSFVKRVPAFYAFFGFNNLFLIYKDKIQFLSQS